MFEKKSKVKEEGGSDSAEKSTPFIQTVAPTPAKSTSESDDVQLWLDSIIAKSEKAVAKSTDPAKSTSVKNENSKKTAPKKAITKKAAPKTAARRTR